MNVSTYVDIEVSRLQVFVKLWSDVYRLNRFESFWNDANAAAPKKFPLEQERYQFANWYGKWLTYGQPSTYKQLIAVQKEQKQKGKT